MATMTSTAKFDKDAVENATAGSRIRGAAPEDWMATFREVYGTVSRRVMAETKARPAVALGIAAGAGFILGGGLGTRMGRLTLLGLVELALRDGKRAREIFGDAE